MKWWQRSPRQFPLWPSAELLGRVAVNPLAYAPTAASLTPHPPNLIAAFRAEELAYLTAVVAQPTDDVPRHAYCDWLHGYDADEATRLRVQLAQPAITFPATPRQLQQLAPWGARDALSRRGFIEHASLTGRSFISLGGVLLSIVPLRSLCLIAVRHIAQELWSCSHLKQLVSLDLHGQHLGTHGVRGLLTCPHLTHVVHLDLRANSLTETDWHAVANMAWLQQLHTLRVSDSELSVASRVLLRTKFGERLQAE
jgi:uncharacterized protein (TIGR02996 family)